jgi:spermidine synthase
MTRGADAAGARLAEAAFALLLTASGAAALVHETAWFRFLVPVLGAGIAPAAAVSAGALLGLAVGAALGGRLADRLGRPALAFAIAEGAGALLCLLVPVAVPALEPLEGPLAPAAAALLLAVAAVPLGASLPAAVRAIGPPREAVGACFRRVYAWNTVGAVLGVALSAGFLLEGVGNRGAVHLAAAVQGAVGLLGLALARRRAAVPVVGASPVPPAARPHLLAAALAGAAGLAVQVAWIRRLVPALIPTFQVFALVLGVHLLSLAVGSLLLGPRRGIGARRVLVPLAVVSALLVAIVPLLMPSVVRAAALEAAASDGGALEVLWIRARAALLLVLPSTVVGAAFLPWLLRAASPETAESGKGAGRLLAWNTAGSAVGALATALLWIPSVGTAAVLRGAAALYLAAGAAVAGGGRTGPVLRAAALLLLVQPLILPVADDAGRDSVGVAYAPFEYDPADARPLLHEEGPVATVVVRDLEGRLEFWVDGSVEASLGPTDRLHLALLGHLPMALLSASGVEAPRVAVIGLGAGFTSQAVSGWSPLELRIHEIEPAVVRAARHFEREGGGVPQGARVLVGDGRRGVQRAPEPLHLVTSDPVHPANAGSAWLYSLDHYRALATRLAPGGIVCEWLPLYQMTSEDLRLVVRTFAEAFPSSYLFLAGADSILVGARAPLRLSEERLREALASPAGAPLAALGLRSPGRLLGLLVRDPDGMRRLAGEGPLNTDDHLLLEFRAGRNAALGDPAANARLVAIGRPDPAVLLDAPPSERFEEERAEARRFAEGMRTWLDRDFARAAEVFGERAERDPLDLLARRMRDDAVVGAARARLAAGDSQEAARLARGVATSPEAEPWLRLDAAEVLWNAGLAEEARATARSVLRAGDFPRARRIVEAEAESTAGG